jgi:hypothetical protein
VEQKHIFIYKDKKNMRLLFTLFLLFYFNVSYTQKEEISVVSKNMDTLWLINNDTGRLIARSWGMGNLPPGQKIPVILIVDALPINTESEKRKYRK